MQFAALPIRILASVAVFAPVSGVDFLKSGLIAEGDVQASFSSEMAMASFNGSSDIRLQQIQEGMTTMYTSLPKNSMGKLTHQAVRYALHRFFVHKYGWFMRGLEPNNDTWHGAADPNVHNSSAMKEWIPSYLQDILEQKLGDEGTDLRQLAALAAALEDLIQTEATGRLQAAYDMFELSNSTLLPRPQVDEMLETYYVSFLNSGDFIAASRAEALKTLKDFIAEYAGWAEAEQWLRDLSKKYLEANEDRFGFDSLQRVVNKMGEEYYALNDADCNDLKDTLKHMQGNKPGRVRLSSFYNKGMYSHWDFSEKAEYLRDLGVLDESDEGHPSVIIANYAMARPNCLDSSNLYTICCRNECEDLMGGLEKQIGVSAAEPAEIAAIVSEMPSVTVSAPRKLAPALLNRLDDIATQNGGQVPLHGRLFAQWMHHAYPLECPFPHETGNANPLTRGEWMSETGKETERASTEEMMAHIQRDSCAVDSVGGVGCADETADIPWSNSEELLTAHAGVLRLHRSAPRSAPREYALGSMLLVCSLVVAGLTLGMRYVRRACKEQEDNGKMKYDMSTQVAWRSLGGIGLLSLAAFFVGLLDGYLFLCIVGCGLASVMVDGSSWRTHKTSSKMSQV